jgi:hypothetical protein
MILYAGYMCCMAHIDMLVMRYTQCHICAVFRLDLTNTFNVFTEFPLGPFNSSTILS